MIDRDHSLSVSTQAKLLNMSLSSVYYCPCRQVRLTWS